MCPVCLYDKTEYIPDSHDICERCGTEFGYDDCTKSHEQLRREWESRGSVFWFTDNRKLERPPWES